MNTGASSPVREPSGTVPVPSPKQKYLNAGTGIPSSSGDRKQQKEKRSESRGREGGMEGGKQRVIWKLGVAQMTEPSGVLAESLKREDCQRRDTREDCEHRGL